MIIGLLFAATGDYRAAVFEGATMVRIGTAVFGPRQASFASQADVHAI